jgi:hypothetical protein
LSFRSQQLKNEMKKKKQLIDRLAPAGDFARSKHVAESLIRVHIHP